MNSRIVVIGAGIMGASIAYHLAKRGARVNLIERERPGAGATEKSFAWINAGFTKHPRPYFDLNLAGIAGWRRWEHELSGRLRIQWGGSVEWHPEGAAAAELRGNVRRHQEWGYATHLVEASELGELLPGVEPGEVAAGAFSELEGTVDPVEALQAVLEKTMQFGAVLSYPCEVTGFRLSNGIITAVRTSQGDLEANAVVLAAGTGTPGVAKLAEVVVPLKESIGVLAHSRPRPELLHRVALAPGAHIKQNADGRVVTGSDFGGAPVTDGGPEQGGKMLQAASRFLPALDGAGLEFTTVGHRVMPEDEFPIAGFCQTRPNLYVAAMHSGITLSPLIGQLAAAEILDGVSVDLLSPFRLSRFGG